MAVTKSRKIFWGVFLIIVLYVGVDLTNFSTNTKLQEALRDMGGYSMPVGPYAAKMVEFFNKNGRWPTDTEIVLPEPSAAGIVDSVRLEPDGMLVLKLQGLVWLQRPQVKVAVMVQAGHEGFGWTSACVDVSPQDIATVIYSHCPRTSLLEVQETQQEAIVDQENYLEKQKRAKLDFHPD